MKPALGHLPCASSLTASASPARTSQSTVLSRVFTRLVPLLAFVLAAGTLSAQVNGAGEIQGSITDPSGAAVPKVSVKATNIATGVVTARESNKTGTYTVGPLQPGEYVVEFEVKGFEKQRQEHVLVDALQNLGLNIKLTVGSATETVTVSETPPQLDTDDASVGGTIENEMYSQLPLSMNAGPRDPTAFQFLMPGVQEGPNGRGIFGGSGQENLNEVYIDGVPVTNITAQGDKGPISGSISVDAVDQFQVKTAGAGVAFGGVGVTNYTIKAGGNKFHGTVFDYIRNTLFDTWGYFSKVPAANGYAVKPGEHQNSYGVSLGGPILRDKFFFFGTYEGFHYTRISNTPQYITVPTLRERNGDFTELYGTSTPYLWDPTKVPQGSTGGRPQFQGLLNGLPTNNVIPASEISSISNFYASALPAPTNSSTANNYLAGLPLANTDYRIDTRLDYTISPRHQVSITAVGGSNGSGQIPRYTTLQQLPLPYANATFTNQRTASGVLTYTFVASQSIINSLKYGFTRNWGPGFAATTGTPFTGAASGIGNLPPGNASDVIPNFTFGYNANTSAASPYSWGGGGSTGGGGTNTFTLIDNLSIIRGRHNITLGIQYQWLETNGDTYGSYSNTVEFDYSANQTECLGGGCPTTGFQPLGGAAYASYLIGAVMRSRIEAQSITTIGGRYRPFAPYVSDNWRVNSRLTLDLGLRWDYLQPYHEVEDRIAFLDPTKPNPAIGGYPGVLMYAGHGAGPDPRYTPYICQCDTPVNAHVSNFEPRLGGTYAINRSTVLRGGFGITTTHAGGVGGRAGATVGTGTSAYGATTVWGGSQGSTGPPAFFLNPSLTTLPNSLYTSPGGDTSSIPVWTVPGFTLNPLGAAGNYTLNGTNPYGCNADTAMSQCTPSALNYADPNYGGRGPQSMNWNFGFQRIINKAAVLSVNYVGSQSHFLAGGGNRGYAVNAVNPDYLIPLGTAGILNSTVGNTATVAAAQKVVPGFHVPFSNYGGNTATVIKALSPFPQFTNNTDLWGQTGNSNYNSLQISVVQRPWHGLSGLVNYTWSKSIDDTHGHRSQYPVGPQDGNFTQYYPSDRVDRGLGTSDQRNAFNATWVYGLPFGKGQFFGNHALVNAVAGGWGVSGIYKHRAGVPLQISQAGNCNVTTNGGQGGCFPDYTPGFDPKKARINGAWGKAPGATAATIGQVQYLDPAAFQCPDNSNCSTLGNNGGTWKIGNISKSGADGLIGPGWWDLDMGLRRTFQIVERSSLNLKFNLEADVINVTNSTFFNLGNGGAAWGTCPVGATFAQCTNLAYGTVGGQNGAVPPRDWQFAGRFTF